MLKAKESATESSRLSGPDVSTKKQRRTPGPDWRTPLFYWRGKVCASTWSGTWVASTEGLPSDDAFFAKHEANAFHLTCSKGIDTLVEDSQQTLAEDLPTVRPAPRHSASRALDLLVGGGATLPLTHSVWPQAFLSGSDDIEHKICFQDGPSTSIMGESEWVSVAARGKSTDFGDFISLGTMVRGMDGTQLLTLARRYIADDDPRCAMSAQDALARVSGEDEGPDMWACDKPWLALPCKVHDDWPAPQPVPAKVLADRWRRRTVAARTTDPNASS